MFCILAKTQARFFVTLLGKKIVSQTRAVRFSVRGFGRALFYLQRSKVFMPDYKRLYHKMFNKVTDIIEELQNLQQEVEEEYISNDTNCKKFEPKTKLRLVKKTDE